ncbi:MAG: hypothetical protein ABI175_15615, partial [Polyangiales bacterium]
RVRVVVAVAIVCLLSGCTKRGAGTAAGVGAGIAIAGIVVFSAAPNGNSAPSEGEAMGILLVLGGNGIAAVALLSLLLQALAGVSTGTPSTSASPDGRKCVPVAPNSSTWTCGDGYRCSDDFDDCEPANGLSTLRQR